MRLVDADALTADILALQDCPNGYSGTYDKEHIIGIIEEQPTVEPTLYGYKIEHLALIARVMQKDGVTPEKAVQIFKDVQTIALRVIDEISGALERAFEQVTEVRGNENDTAD